MHKSRLNRKTQTWRRRRYAIERKRKREEVKREKNSTHTRFTLSFVSGLNSHVLHYVHICENKTLTLNNRVFIHVNLCHWRFTSVFCFYSIVFVYFCHSFSIFPFLCAFKCTHTRSYRREMNVPILSRVAMRYFEDTKSLLVFDLQNHIINGAPNTSNEYAYITRRESKSKSKRARKQPFSCRCISGTFQFPIPKQWSDTWCYVIVRTMHWSALTWQWLSPIV